MDMETAITEWPPEHEIPSTVRARAANTNGKCAQCLGWQRHLPRIAKLLGVSVERSDDKRLVPAVWTWQQFHDLATDGIIGPNTWRKMRRELTQTATGCAQDASYEELLRCIRAELSRKFSSPDAPGVHLRRKRLRALFRQIPADRACELSRQLGQRATKDELSRLFHHRLATAARRELLNILDYQCYLSMLS